MNAELRYEALATADGPGLRALADRVLATGAAVEITAGPETMTSAIRVPVPGTAATSVIGHVALTTCALLLGGVRGDGCRAGRDLDTAIAAAVCDAEAERQGPLAPDVAALAQRAVDERSERQSVRAHEVALTRLEDV